MGPTPLGGSHLTVRTWTGCAESPPFPVHQPQAARLPRRGGIPLNPDVAAPRTARLHSLIENIERAILGKREAVTLTVVGLLAEGHVLLEDVPGTGKTTLARALARSLDVEFRRIQFTSDLLPADLLGLSVFHRDESRFVFRPGPVFGNVILADELNRTTPRTQSALLECMQERRVSIEGETRELPRPFLVLATQNPLEFEGTYPLPESQLDRFLLSIRLGYVDRENERALLERQTDADPLAEIQPMLAEAELLECIAAVKEVRLDERLLEYVLDVVEATRKAPGLRLGASTRAALGWARAARALALLEGRDYCTPDDVQRLARPILAHRLVPLLGETTEGAEVLERILAKVPVPS